MAKAKVKTIKLDPLKMRTLLGMNQSDFWKRYGVTQSGGSRYEAGRAMPKPLRMLMVIEQDVEAVRGLMDGSLAASV